MANDIAVRDQNQVPALLGIDNVTGEVRAIKVDSSGKVLLTIAGYLPSGAAGGDLSGTYPNPTVISLEHITTLLSGAATQGSVLFMGATGVSQDNANLNWDDTNYQLSVSQTGTLTNSFVVNSVSNTPAFNIVREGTQSKNISTGFFCFSSTSAGASSTFNMIRARGTQASPVANVSGDFTGQMRSYGYNGTDFENNISMSFSIDGTPTSGAGGAVPGKYAINIQVAGGALGTSEVVHWDTVGNAIFTRRTTSVNRTASTEDFSFRFDSSRVKTYATGNFTTLRDGLYSAPTIAFAGASTITDGASFAISGGMVAGTNATGTNSHALLIQSGNVTSGWTNSYGLTVNAQTGATNNYVAQFLGGVTKFGGAIDLSGTGGATMILPADATANAAAQAGRIPVTIGGVTRYLYYYGS